MKKEEIQKKIRADFSAKDSHDEEYYDWTEDELMGAAKRIAKKMGLTEPFYKGGK